jgi:hypothetical protein
MSQNLDNTQLVCTHEPRCLCSGRDFDCDCRSFTSWPALQTMCTDCGQPMVLIDCDTGAIVQEPAA